MTLFEATYNNKYVVRGRDNLVSAKDKIASCINSTWVYSMHWKIDSWHIQAKEDLNTEIIAAKERIRELEQAKSILNKIEME